MESVILVCHLIIAVALIAVILVQPSESGGFLGSGGSMSNMLAPRRSEDILTRLTKVLAGLFFTTSLMLAIMATHHPRQTSILDVATDTAPSGVEQPAANDDKTSSDDDAAVKAKLDTPKEEPVKPKAPIAK